MVPALSASGKHGSAVALDSPIFPGFSVAVYFESSVLWWVQEKSSVFQFVQASLYLFAVIVVRMGVTTPRLVFTCGS